MNLNKSVAIGVVVALSSLALGGCAAAQNDESKSTSSEEAPAAQPDAFVPSGEGVTLETSEPDHVRGRLDRDGASIRFDITRQNDTRHVVITTVTGEPLLDSTLTGNTDDSKLLGGRMHIVGVVGEEPMRAGDEAVIAELAAKPEGKIIFQLKDALEGAGVDNSLIRYTMPIAKADGVQTRVWPSWGGGPHGHPDNTWYYVGSMQSLGFFSWGFWSTTAVRADGYHAISIQAGSAGATYHYGSTGNSYYGQWWGAYVTVRNIRVPLCSVYYPYSCQNVSTWLLIK